MSIEIDVLNGDASWPLAEPLYQAIWPLDVVAQLPWADLKFAHADLRVLILREPDGAVCHAGIYRRDITWNERHVPAAGIGGVMTRQGDRGRGYATVALDAAIQTLKDEGSATFALLFCEPQLAPFYTARGWKAFGGDVYADQPNGRIQLTALAPYLYDLRGRAPQQGVIDLRGLPW